MSVLALTGTYRQFMNTENIIPYDRSSTCYCIAITALMGGGITYAVGTLSCANIGYVCDQNLVYAGKMTIIAGVMLNILTLGAKIAAKCIIMRVQEPQGELIHV